MPDREKVIGGLERCLVCNLSVFASEEAQKAYIDCEYTTGLYCRHDMLIRDALAILKEQEEEIKRLKVELHGFSDLFGELSEKADKAIAEQPQIVLCKDCKYFEVKDWWGNFDGFPVLATSDCPTCNKWADGCMTNPEGYCFLAEQKRGDAE